MASMAYDISNGRLIDLTELLEQKTFEQLAAAYADKPSNYCCAECLATMQGLSNDQLLVYKTSGLTPDSSFKIGRAHV